MFATEFVYESNLIENINISFDALWLEWASEKLTGHLEALLLATIDANQRKYLTEQKICEWQKLIIQEQNSLQIFPEKPIREHEMGIYRKCGVSVGSKLCMPPQAVPICMKQLICEICYFQKQIGLIGKTEIIKRIADFHFDFLQIHPFVDGNGRTSRILAWYLFKYFGLKPFIFTNADKHKTYYKAFNGMRNYFMQKAAL